MNIGTKILKKYWQIKSSNILKYLYTLIKWILCQIWKAGSALLNLLMYVHAKTRKP